MYTATLHNKTLHGSPINNTYQPKVGGVEGKERRRALTCNSVTIGLVVACNQTNPRLYRRCGYMSRGVKYSKGLTT